MSRLRHTFYLLLEKLLAWVLVPQLRARLLGLLGATVGHNVRIYEVRLFNLEQGFRHLVIGDDVHIGHGTLIDLSDRVVVASGAVISPRCILLSHTNAGDQHGSPMVAEFPTSLAPCEVGEQCYLGAGVTVLSGVRLGARTAVAAGAVVVDSTEGDELVAGTPARRIRRLFGQN